MPHLSASRFSSFFSVLWGATHVTRLDAISAGRVLRRALCGAGCGAPGGRPLTSYLASLGKGELAERQGDAERAIAEMGITFTVYTEGQNIDRAWPFDVIPPHDRSDRMGANRARASSSGSPRSTISSTTSTTTGGLSPTASCPKISSRPPSNFLRLRRRQSAARRLGQHLRHRLWFATPTAPSTCSRTTCACPSGVSYMLENRQITKQVFPEVFEAMRRSCRSTTMPRSCFDMLASLSPRDQRESRARRAHARHLQLRVLRALVPRAADGRRPGRGRDLVVADDDCVYMRTIARPRARRRHLSPHRRRLPRPRGLPTRLDARRPGLMRAWRARQRRARQRARRGRRRRQGRLRLRARHHPATISAKTRSCRTSRRTLCCDETQPRATCSPTSTSSS